MSKQSHHNIHYLVYISFCIVAHKASPHSRTYSASPSPHPVPVKTPSVFGEISIRTRQITISCTTPSQNIRTLTPIGCPAVPIPQKRERPNNQTWRSSTPSRQAEKKKRSWADIRTFRFNMFLDMFPAFAQSAAMTKSIRPCLYLSLYLADPNSSPCMFNSAVVRTASQSVRDHREYTHDPEITVPLALARVR